MEIGVFILWLALFERFCYNFEMQNTIKAKPTCWSVKKVGVSNKICTIGEWHIDLKLFYLKISPNQWRYIFFVLPKTKIDFYEGGCTFS